MSFVQELEKLFHWLINHSLQAGVLVLLVLSPVVHGRDFFILDGNSFQASVGERGRFAFNYVPPVEMTVALKIPTGPGSWTSRRLGTVQVDPGETAHAEFPENGRTVTGKVEVTGTNAPFDFQNALAALERGDKAILQEMAQLKTAEAWRKFRESPAVKATLKSHQRYPVRLDQNGSFRTEVIPAGTYEFSVLPNPIRFRQGVPTHSVQMLLSSRVITVPKPKNASEPGPLNLGTLKLQTLTIPVESPSFRGE